MPRGDFILNAVSYVVVFIIGAIVGGVAGGYIGVRITYMRSPTAISVCAAAGSIVGGIAALVFALGYSQHQPTLREVHERMEKKDR